MKFLGTTGFCASFWPSEWFQIAVPSVQERFLVAVNCSFTICLLIEQKPGYVCLCAGEEEDCAFRFVGKLKKMVLVHGGAEVSLGLLLVQTSN